MGKLQHIGDAMQQSSMVDAPSEAGIQVAARQALFDYATQQGLAILGTKVTGLVLPEVSKTFHVPIAGDFELRIYNIKVQEFAAPAEDARLVILARFFNLWVEQVHCHVTFDWHWEKPGLGLQGTGDGELFLRNGVIQYVFSATKDGETSSPELDIKVADSFFESTELKIHSFSADWLYQAILSLFNDRINSAINKGIAQALSDDVPKAVNNVLSSLPTHLDIKGLPFSTAFEYSIYTFTYVLLKGFGEVDTPTSPTDASDSPHGVQRCPFEATPLPLSSDALALDPYMLTVYLHESMLNCMAWGMYNVGALRYSVADGTIPKLHLTTNLLVMLLPMLPKTYPHQLIKIDAEALSAPKVSFTSEGGSVDVAYRTSIYLDNETLSTPLIAQLDAHVVVSGIVTWDTTTVSSVSVTHTVVQSSMDVPTAQWDTTVAWFIQNYAGLYPLRLLVDQFVKTPVTSLAVLDKSAAKYLDGWFALSGDIALRNPAVLAGQGQPS